MTSPLCLLVRHGAASVPAIGLSPRLGGPSGTPVLRCRGRIGSLIFLFLALAVPASARPQVLVVIADHLTLADETRADLPNLTRLRIEGQMALMSPGLPQGKDPIANVYATLGAGDSIRVGDVSQGRLRGSLRRAGARTALIGDADGDDTDEYRPALALLPLADNVHVGPDDGTVPDPVACGGKRIDPRRLKRSMTRRWKSGCIMRRCRRQKSPSLVMMPLPSRILTRSMPSPLV